MTFGLRHPLYANVGRIVGRFIPRLADAKGFSTGRVASLAAYPSMMRRDRERLGLRECHAAWLLGLTVREYRVLEAGDTFVTSDLWDRMVEVYGLYGWSRQR